MAIIPGGQQIRTTSSDVDLTNRGNSLVQSQNQVYTMDDIVETVNSESSGGKVINGYFYQEGTNDPVVTIFQNTTGETITATRASAGLYNFDLSNSIDVPNGFTFTCRNTYGGSTKKYIDGLVSWTGQGQPITKIIFSVWNGSETPVDLDEGLYISFIYFELKVF
jgi:hypothetical protein